MKIHVRAPATTANIGPGFDCAAAALDLWNELEVEEGEGDVDHAHLGIQAFARLASTEGKTFRFTDRIPRERGLGSSAAVVALGLVAGAIAAVVAVVVGAVVIQRPSSTVSIPSRIAAPSAAPDGWTLVTHDDLSLAIPNEWTPLETRAREAFVVGTSAFPRTGPIIPCDFPGAQAPTVPGTWVTVFEYRDLHRNDEVPLELVPALRTTDDWVPDRPVDLRTAVAVDGGCATGRYQVIAFRDAGRVFVAILATDDVTGDQPFDLGARVLNTLHVGELETSPTTATAGPTTLTVPPTVPPTLPAVTGPDEAAVRDVFLAWINAQPKDALEGIVEDFASIADVHRQGTAQHTDADLATYAGQVDSVKIVSPTRAEVQYTILHNGVPDFSRMPGEAVKIDGKWMVTRQTVCNLLKYGGLTCPPRS